MAEATESAASVSEPAQGHTDTKRGRKKISKKPAADASAPPLPAEATAPAPTTDASAPPRPAEAATPVPITSETKAEAAPAAPAPVASPPPAANITPQAETTALAPTTGAFAPPAAAPPAEIATSPAEATTPPQTTNASADTAPPAPTASASMPPAANTTPSAETATAPTTGTSSPPTAAPKPVASAPHAETATPAPTTRASAPPAAAPPAEIATPAPTRGTSAPAEATTPLPTTSASAPAAAPPAPTASASTPPAAETPPAETSTPAPTLVASAPPEAATPAPPSPPPMSEEEQLRFQLADAVKVLAAAQQNATPSPYHRNRNKDAAERYALSCVESRYLQSESLASPVRTYDDIASHLSPLSRHKVLRPSPTHPLSAPAELPASPTRHRTLPPLANSGSVRGLSSSPLLSASASQGLCLQNSRVANATLAMSTRSRLMPERDEKQEAEVKLVHALEEHALVSHQHALTSAQYSALVAAKTALADEELQHRLAANELRKELRVAQAALIDAEKRILAQHGKLRDLVLRLQRSRLRMTKEEEDLSSQLLALRKELADLQRTSRDDEAQFNAAMDATSARAAELEHQLKFFDADTFVEDIELGDLRDAMQKHSLGIAAAHHALHAGRAFKTFNYSDGGWAPNVAQNETIRPPTTSSVASNPTPAPSKIPPQATSSVALLSGKAQSKRHHAATVSTTEVEAQIVLEMIESGAGASVTEMPPTARFEHALKAYKAAVQGSSKSQATLRKFLAGEF